MWWHDVLSLDDFGSLINFWWRDGEPPLLIPLNALYHAVITMRDLPPNELAAWRNMFNHYLLEMTASRRLILPAQARGHPRAAHAGAGRPRQKASARGIEPILTGSGWSG